MSDRCSVCGAYIGVVSEWRFVVRVEGYSGCSDAARTWGDIEVCQKCVDIMGHASVFQWCLEFAKNALPADAPAALPSISHILHRRD